MSEVQTSAPPAEVKYTIPGIFSIPDIKHDLLKIIEPYDGYMFNRKETDKVRSLFVGYLGDLQRSHKIREYNIFYTVKDNAVTFDVGVKIHRDRATKKLKIHVGSSVAKNIK
jgi:hypothetical protein